MIKKKKICIFNIKLFFLSVSNQGKTPMRNSTGKKTPLTAQDMKHACWGNQPSSCPSQGAGKHYTVVSLMKSAHTKADVLTVEIKVVRVIPEDLPLSPMPDLYKRPISHSHRVPVSTLWTATKPEVMFQSVGDKTETDRQAGGQKRALFFFTATYSTVAVKSRPQI